MLEQDQASQHLKTFVRHLGKNHMGQSFIRLVSSSLDRKTVYSERSRLVFGERHSQSQSKCQKAIRLKTQQPDRTLLSFKVKEGALGDSVSMRDLSPRRMEQNVRERVGSRGGLFKGSLHMASKLQSMVLDRRMVELREGLRVREGYLKLNGVGNILSRLTGNANVSTLRIYKQKLRKFYNARYVREKLTSFFQYEYIQDYDSQLGILQTLLELKAEEIYFLCFLVLDQNGDGLVCNSDLFSISTSSVKENPLLKHDIYRIFKYVATVTGQGGMAVVDAVSEEEQFKSHNHTLQRFRFLEMKGERERTKKLFEESSVRKESRVPVLAREKKDVLTRRTGKHLFSLRREQEAGQTAIRELRKRFADIQLQSKTNFNFKINFSRFKQIFANSIPEIYYDILYAQGGIKLPEKTYLELNFDIEEQEHRENAGVAVDRYRYFREQVAGMRETSRRSRVESWHSQNLPMAGTRR